MVDWIINGRIGHASVWHVFCLLDERSRRHDHGEADEEHQPLLLLLAVIPHIGMLLLTVPSFHHCYARNKLLCRVGLFAHQLDEGSKSKPSLTSPWKRFSIARRRESSKNYMIEIRTFLHHIRAFSMISWALETLSTSWASKVPPESSNPIVVPVDFRKSSNQIRVLNK